MRPVQFFGGPLDGDFIEAPNLSPIYEVPHFPPPLLIEEDPPITLTSTMEIYRSYYELKRFHDEHQLFYRYVWQGVLRT